MGPWCTEWGSILYFIKENRISSWIHEQRSINSLHHQLHYMDTYRYFVVFKTSDSRFLDISIFYIGAPGILMSCHIEGFHTKINDD